MSEKKPVTPPDTDVPDATEGEPGNREDPGDERDSRRDRRGRFLPGNNANPSGRPKSLAEFREALTEHVPTALAVLVSIMGDPMAQHKDRIAAAVHLLDRKFGKPAQAVEVTGRDGGPLEHADKTPVLTSEQRGRKLIEMLNQVAALAGGPAEGEAKAGEGGKP